MFCENCGTKLLPDSKFCEQCGHTVTSTTPDELEPLTTDMALFSKWDWMEHWKKLTSYCTSRIELVLINTKHASGLTPFKQTLAQYIRFKATQGIICCILDMNTQCIVPQKDCVAVENVVCVLQQIYQVARPDFLMLIGDRESIGSARWENHSRDSDKYVDSDLPYITLDTCSPWSGQAYELSSAVPVGRVPAQASTGFRQASDYFKQVMEHSTLPQQAHGFTLCAAQWDGVSRQIHKKSLNKSPYHSSPPAGKTDFIFSLTPSGQTSPNLLYFNLHGTKDTEIWYGQKGDCYPDAFSPQCFDSLKGGYLIGTEACYGAKPVYGGKPTMLTHALENGCLAFVGSSQIAYGGTGVIGCCADLVVGEYIEALTQGSCAGEAFLRGLRKLITLHRTTDSDIKTLAEFALYGDPAISLSGRATQAKSVSSIRGRGILVPMPDVRRAVELRLVQMSQEISDKLSDYIKTNHPNFSGMTPEYYQVSGYGGYQAMYSDHTQYGEQILKIYFDSAGSIDRVCVSKS